jgi:hypothetical protein
MLRDQANNPTGANPLALKAAYARRLSDDEVLIVNGYYGHTRNNQTFNGEVVQLDSSTYNPSALNLGFGNGSLTFKLSSVTGSRGILLPVFADRR